MLAVSGALLVPGVSVAAADSPHGPSVGAAPGPLHLLPAAAHILPPVARGHLHRSVHGLTVYPYTYYSSEPAPMGLADFGVNNNTNSSYTYRTTSFWGSATMQSLTLYNSGLGSYDYDGTMQLNVVLEFDSGGNYFEYWIQDVLYLSTSTSTANFENNIWNFTDGNTYGMLPSTVSGVGSVQSFGGLGYYYAAAGSQPGNGISLHYPATVNLRVNATTALGTPEVQFQFADGKGWQTYDTVKFVFTKSVASSKFVVDGNSNADGYLYTDAELVWGGPGGGSSTVMTKGGMEMGLEFYNGHNYQNVSNAFNFGSDTGESISSVYALDYPNATTGQYQSHLIVSSLGTVKNLYDRFSDALFNGTTAIPSGAYAVNGYVIGNFTNHGLNLTLFPGKYNISLLVNGTPKENVTVYLDRGEYFPYDFDYHYHPPNTFPLVFTSQGLPPGTPWGVSVYNVNGNTTSASILALVPNGTYRWVVNFVPGYHPNITSGFITVNGLGDNFTISWTIQHFPVTAKVLGLPANTRWNITLNGTSTSGTAATFLFELPNGTYGFSLGPVPGYRALAWSGNFTVQGSAYALVVSFVRVLYVVTFSESGLPVQTGWVLSIDGANHSTAASMLQLNLANGTYNYSVSTGSPYLPTPSRGVLSVVAGASPVGFAFAPQPGTVFGAVLPGNATVLVNGTEVTLSSGGEYSVQLPPGSYRIVVTAPGYHAYFYNFTLAPGQPLRVNVHLTPVQPTAIQHSVGPASIWTPLTFLVLIAVIAAVAVGTVASLARRPRGGEP
ncbi:MAG TPA: thermopsin family protease [Thermoplasmata archaeon]|nr:thermopsin family protease [Thermoplasmata archaeon]